MSQTRLQVVLTSYFKENAGKETELAERFQVAVSEVEDWRNGAKVPNQKIEYGVYRYIENVFKRKLSVKLPISGATGARRLARLGERADFLRQKLLENPQYYHAAAELSALNWAIDSIMTYEDMLS